MPEIPNHKNRSGIRFQALTAAFLLFFTLLVRLTWPEGTDAMRRFLIPAEQTVTEAAFSEMVGSIQSGEPVGDSITAFCRQILEHGIEEVS